MIRRKRWDWGHVSKILLFFKKKALLLLKLTDLNQYIIKLQESYQLSSKPIYSLHQVELKMLKIYIKTKLANGLIWQWKSPANISILFVKKPNGSFWLSINYQNPNNLTIKNQNLLSLINKLLDYLNQTKQFSWRDFIIA